jgi:hypothetical protein
MFSDVFAGRLGISMQSTAQLGRYRCQGRMCASPPAMMLA